MLDSVQLTDATDTKTDERHVNIHAFYITYKK
jgi:hypothetical protein